MNEENTAVAVMETLEGFARTHGTIDWMQWMTGAAKLVALLQNEEDELAEMEHELIKMKAKLIEEGRPANQAKLMVEADDRYLAVMKKRAFIKRCDATIMVCKKFATISSDQSKY